MLTDGWICAGGAAIGMITEGWICVPLADAPAEVVDNPLIPLHITQITAGMQIRISLKGGHQMVPKVTKRGNFLVPTDKRRHRRGYEKGVLIGTVTANNPAIGKLSMYVSDDTSKLVYQADVDYTAMGVTQRVVPITTLVETATSPGSVAIGTKLVGGQLLNPRDKLVHIKF